MLSVGRACSCVLLFLIELLALAPLAGALDQVCISNVGNITVSAYTGSGSPIGNDDFRVYDAGDGDFTVQVSGGGSGFYLTADGKDPIPYHVYVKGSTGLGVVGDYEELTHEGTPVSVNGAAGSNGCVGGDTSNLMIMVNENDLGSAEPGTYQTSLGITVWSE